jgi:argininosuccinate lyase
VTDTSEQGDAGRFPAPAYRDTVLAPLFESVKRHHWRDLIRVNRAHAVMLSERGLLSARDASAILGALDTIESELTSRLDALHYNGTQEDFFFFVEGELCDRLGSGVAGRLHTGRSRNDMDQTILKMSLKRRLLVVIDSVAAVIEALLETATRDRDTLIVAYTHGQPAQPTTWGHYLGGMIEVLLRDAHRLLHAYATADLCSMGAAAITTTGFPIDRDRMATLLGFARVQDNSYGAIAACDYVTEAFQALKVMLINVGRFAQDLGQRTAFEVGHLRVPDGFVQRSSIMPQKRNPVPIEHLRLLSSTSIGQCDAVVLAMHNTPFADVNDNDYAVHETGYAAIETALRVLSLLEALLRAVRIDEAAVRRDIDASCISMTEVADSLVRSEGVSFGEAHDICSRLARAMILTQTTLTTVPYTTFAEAFGAVMGRRPSVDEATFRAFATPEHFIAVRTVAGGPAPAPLARSLASYREALGAVRALVAAHRLKHDSAATALAEAVARAQSIPTRPATDSMSLGEL